MRIFLSFLVFIIIFTQSIFAKETKILELVKSINAHSSNINSLALSPDNKTLISVGNDGEMKVWKFPSLIKIRDIKDLHKNINIIAYSHNIFHTNHLTQPIRSP